MFCELMSPLCFAKYIRN
uniref:Uncharacterized protein n=1 Tax=Arundo donax TaxID=35708 RepID=A0A0A9EI44_ARUDO